MIFSPSPSSLQKNFHLCLSRDSTIIFGRRYNDIWYIKELDRLAFINVALPAIERELPFQVDSFFSFFSTNGNQSLTWILLGLTGTPKYLMGKVPICQLNILVYWMHLVSSPLIRMTSLLAKLILRPDSLPYKYSRSFIFLATSKSSLRQIMVSSAYCRMATPFSIKLSARPQMSFFLCLHDHFG